MGLTVIKRLKLAAEWIRSADGLIVIAGGGMGVDSGLPDFHGNDGFWRVYPDLLGTHLRSDFSRATTADAVHRNPELAWRYYEHLLDMFNAITPHEGYHILAQWGERMANGLFVHTSNVDGQFQRAGYENGLIAETCGSIYHLQCAKGCCSETWATPVWPLNGDFDGAQGAALPTCPCCEIVARPNMQLLDDPAWNTTRLLAQTARFDQWRGALRSPVVIEVGVGKESRALRMSSYRYGDRVIRINTRDWQIERRYGIGLEGKAVEILRLLDTVLQAFYA